MGFSHLSRPGESSSAAELTPSARAVFRSLVASGPATRPQIGEQLALSRPTMSASIGELERLGYVEKVGESQGSLGRKAALYRVGGGAGHVVAIDAGSTHVRLRVATLDHRLLHSRTYRLPASHRLMNEEISRAVAEEFAAAAGETEATWGPLRAIGIALPSRVVVDGAERASTRQDELFTHFTPPAGPELVLENNVNCAAVAENVYGVAQGREDFAYIQIGLKLGMGLMLGGRLIRGRNGAAGEIGHLAYPFAPGHTPVAGEAETYLGTEMLMQRVRQAWPAAAATAAPEDAGALFLRAENGDAVARDHVERHAADIGALVASCVAIVDPGLVVLGGGVGTSQLILPVVRTVANALSYPVAIETSSLGPDATVLGIEKLAVDRALDVVLAQPSP